MATKKSWWLRLLLNKYFLIAMVFVVWMIFLDSHSWLTHDKLDRQIAEKEEELNYHLNQIHQADKQLKALKDSAGLEKYAREKYFMKKEDEEVYLIEFEDSTQKDEDR
jgi:cell division protein FtsB